MHLCNPRATGVPAGWRSQDSQPIEVGPRLGLEGLQLIWEVGFWFGIVSVPGAPRTERYTQQWQMIEQSGIVL